LSLVNFCAIKDFHDRENTMGAKMSSIDKCFFIYVLFLVCMKLAFYLFMFFGLVDWTMEIIGILKREKRRF